MRWAVRIAGLALAVALASSCGDGSGDEATPASQIQRLGPDLVPGELLGLTVAPEDMSASLAKAERSYASAVGLFGLRDRDDVLQATLQVTRFNDEADHDDDRFRDQLLARIGGSLPRKVRVGDDPVFVLRGTRQALSVWFRGGYFFVLSTRERYETPRALLRVALELRP